MAEKDTSLLDDKEVALLLDIANLACHKGMPSEARVIVGAVLCARPLFVPALVTMAYSHLVVDDFAGALEILASVLEKHPDDYDARLIQGMAYLLDGQRFEAEKSFSAISEGSAQKEIAEQLLRTL